MVIMMDDIRDEIARVSEEHDRLMAEDAADAATDLVYTEPPLGTPPVRRATDGRGLVYRPRNDAAADAPQPAPLLSNGDYAVGYGQAVRALGTIHAELQREMGDECELLHQMQNLSRVEIEKLRGEFHTAIVKLKRQLSTMGHELSTMGREIEADRANGIEVYCAGLERRVAVLEAENIKLKAAIAAENAQPRGKLADALKLGDKVKELAAEIESERADREALVNSFEVRFAALHGLVRGLAQDWNAI
jgi:hypothetical protein